MIYFVYAIFFLHFFATEFTIANANDEMVNYLNYSSIYFIQKCGKEELFLEFLKEPQNFKQFCKASGFEKEYAKFFFKYEAYLGVVFLLRKHWHCAKIKKDFKELEREACKKYRNYLDILYEYFFRVYAGLPAVKPMFYYQQIYALSTVTETVKSLTQIADFYFNSIFGKSKGHKLERLFVKYYEPKLFNKNKLNYKANTEKEAFQETVVRMGFDLKWQNGIGESYLNVIRLKFYKILEVMLTKAEELKGLSSKRASSANKLVNLNKYNIRWLLYSVLYKEHTFEDCAIVPFMKGQSNFEQQFCNEMDQQDTCTEFKALSVKFETYLPVLYLMRWSWHCAKSADENEKEKKLQFECEKYRNYVHLIYEYLFIVYATEQRMLAHQMPAIRPMFGAGFYNNISIIETAILLHRISGEIVGHGTAEEKIQLLNKNGHKFNLLNENAFRNYLANFGKWNKTLREEFDNKLKILLKKEREEEKKHKLHRKCPLSESPFYDKVQKKEDQGFIAYLKGQSDFEDFCKKNKKRLPINKDNLPKITTLHQQTEHLAQKYEAHLGVVYLMKEKWKCVENGKELEENELKECQKYRKYLDIFYEYLLSVDSEDDDDPVKAINSQLLIRKIEHFGTLIDVVKCFNEISKSYFKSEFRQTIKYELKNSDMSKQNLEKIFKSEKKRDEEKKEEKQKKFDEKLKKMLQKEEAKLKMIEEEMQEQSIRNIMAKFEEKVKKIYQNKQKTQEGAAKIKNMEEEMEEKRAEFEDKFGTLFDSPFYGTIPK